MPVFCSFPFFYAGSAGPGPAGKCGDNAKSNVGLIALQGRASHDRLQNRAEDKTEQATGKGRGLGTALGEARCKVKASMASKG